jgi:hypothetical protein
MRRGYDALDRSFHRTVRGAARPNLRGVIGSVLVLMGAATAVQTWNLGSGRGSNPANTIDGMSYWVVQLIIIGVVTAVALGVYRLRTRRAMRAGSSLARPAFSGRRGTTVLLGSTLIMTAALSAGALALDSTRTHHGVGAGRIPWTGVLGLVIGVTALIGLAVALALGARAEGHVRRGA